MIAGNVTGLFAGTSVVLQNNGSESLKVGSNGSFFFPGEVKAGTAYAVTVATDPVGGKCTVQNGTGIVGQYAEDVSNILVACGIYQGAIYGNVAGLASGASLIVQNQDTIYGVTTSTPLSIAANGAFAFPTALGIGHYYSVIVSTQPAGQTCGVLDGAGTVPGTGIITPIQITCQ